MRTSSCLCLWFLALGTAIANGAGVANAADTDAPHAVAVWPAGPLEVRVAFDRPVAAGFEQALVGKVIGVDESTRRIANATAGCTLAAPTSAGPTIAGVRRLDQGRLLVLATDPQSRPAVYCLPLPALSALGAPGSSTGPGVAYDLSGVEATWDAGGDDPKPVWTGWWPSLSPETTRQETRGSIEHERSLALLSKPGRLTLRTLLALRQGPVKVRVESTQPLVELSIGGDNAEIGADGATQTAVELGLDAPGDPLYCTIIVRTGDGGKPVALKVTQQDQSSPPSPIGRDLLTVPWAPAPAAAPPAPPAPPNLAGGDPKRGEALFFGDIAKCAGCHQIGGKGQKVGPDLTTVFQRPVAEVFRDVNEPTALIRFEYVPYTMALKDGRVLAGIVRADGADAVRLTDTDAKTTVVPRTQIEELRASTTSVMPVGLVGAIGEANMRDLMAFLMQPKP